MSTYFAHIWTRILPIQPVSHLNMPHAPFEPYHAIQSTHYRNLNKCQNQQFCRSLLMQWWVTTSPSTYSPSLHRIAIPTPEGVGGLIRRALAQGVLDNRQSCLNKVYFAFALNKLYKLYETFSRTLLFLYSLLYSLLYSFCNVATLRISEYLLILPPPPHEPRDREIPTE